MRTLYISLSDQVAKLFHEIPGSYINIKQGRNPVKIEKRIANSDGQINGLTDWRTGGLTNGWKEFLKKKICSPKEKGGIEFAI